MDSPTTHIERLLSGMLDGVLSEAESNELKLAISNDPSLQSQLECLKVMRTSLKEERSGQRLKQCFAGATILAAKQRAEAMGVDAPSWVLQPESVAPVQKSLPPRFDSFPWRRWAFAGGLSLAASVLFLIFSIPNATQTKIAAISGDPVQQTPLQELETIAKSARDAAPAAKHLDTNSPSESEPTSLLAQLETPAKSQPTETPSSPSINPLESLAVEGETKTSVSASDLKTIEPSQVNKKQSFTLTMLLDFSIAPEAVESKALEKILDKHHIVYTDDLVLDEAQLKILEDSNYVGNFENTKLLLEPLNIDDSRIPKVAQKQNTEEKMGVLFLKSRAENLNMAITEIFRSIEQFPDCAFEISTDKSVRQLVTQLGSIQFAESTSGVAKRLSFGGAQGATPFAARAARGKPMSPTNRAKFTSPNAAVLSQDKAQLSYALFLLRPVKK